MSKSIVYYTCNTHDPAIDAMCRAQLALCGLPIVSVSLNKPLDFGDMRLVMDGERSPLMMHRQILAGLKVADTSHVFLCESDVMYHPGHFEKTEHKFGYNVNVWRLRWSDGLLAWTDDLQQVSGILAERSRLFDFYSLRVAEIERDGFDRHYEPRGVRPTNWRSEYPNICIRHDHNLTKSKWSPDDFRNPRYAKGWTTAHSVPGWEITKNGIIHISQRPEQR